MPPVPSDIMRIPTHNQWLQDTTLNIRDPEAHS
jgi:hypothetical protein